MDVRFHAAVFRQDTAPQPDKWNRKASENLLFQDRGDTIDQREHSGSQCDKLWS
jgi:hypothetical protein